MKTVTLADLHNHLSTIVGWVESGEDVVVKGEPAVQPPPAEIRVDWRKSAVFRRPGEERIAMTEAELQEFYRDMRGSY